MVIFRIKMKKMKRNLGLISLLLAGSLFGANENFIGVGIGNGSLSAEAKVTRLSDGVSASGSSEDSGSIKTVIGGTIIDKKHKISIGYSKYNTVSTVDITSIDLGYSYLIDQDTLEIKNKKWKPFIGVGYSMISYSENLGNAYNYDKSEFTADFNALLLSLGTDYEVNKKQFITFSYDIALSGEGSDSTNFSSGGTDYKLEGKVDNASRWLMSYNFKF